MASLAHLTVNSDGVAFNTTSGDTFLVNPSALVILKVFQVGGSQTEPDYDAAVRSLTDAYEVSPDQARHDVVDFHDRLRSLGLL
jgi:PqqD family protein of HPr-rel-A system